MCRRLPSEGTTSKHKGQANGQPYPHPAPGEARCVIDDGELCRRLSTICKPAHAMRWSRKYRIMSAAETGSWLRSCALATGPKCMTWGRTRNNSNSASQAGTVAAINRKEHCGKSACREGRALGDSLIRLSGISPVVETVERRREDCLESPPGLDFKHAGRG